MYLPFMVHAVSFAVFASLIAPFGGFFASGFKRAFEIKVFHSVIHRVWRGETWLTLSCRTLMI